jgi:hypothetical protein
MIIFDVMIYNLSALGFQLIITPSDKLSPDAAVLFVNKYHVLHRLN